MHNLILWNAKTIYMQHRYVSYGDKRKKSQITRTRGCLSIRAFKRVLKSCKLLELIKSVIIRYVKHCFIVRCVIVHDDTLSLYDDTLSL